MDGVVTLRKAAPSDDDKSTVKNVLRWLRADLVRETGVEPSEAELIEAAIRLRVKTDRAAAGDRPRAYGNAMPSYTRTDEEHIDDAKQRLIDFTAGDMVDEVQVTAREWHRRAPRLRDHAQGQEQSCWPAHHGR